MTGNGPRPNIPHMKTIRRILRMPLLLAHLMAGVLLAAVLCGERHSRTRERVRQWWHGRLCRILGLRTHVRGSPVSGPALYVANHVSWLDIPVLGALAPVVFLSKGEIRHWPVIGWFAVMADTIFIERGGRNAAGDAAARIAAALAGGTPVAVFPEGTTTDGPGLRRFHARLFAAAVETGVPVQPVALRYVGEDGGWHPLAPFIGDDRLPAHLWRIAGERRVDVEVVFCPVPGLPESGDVRRGLAEAAHRMIAQELGVSRT